MQNPVAIVRLGAVCHNAVTFKNYTGAKLCAVVKANAYGHGAAEVVGALSQIADCFAVATATEGQGIALAACGKPVLVFTPPATQEEAIFLVRCGMQITVADTVSARFVAEAARALNVPAAVHLKVNAGMNRYGVSKTLLGRICKALSSERLVRVEGVYSHLYEHTPCAALRAREIFEENLRVAKRYFPSVTAHLSATYGAFLGKPFAYDMVRIGLGLYGYQPSGFTPLPLKKAMEVYAPCTAARRVSFGGLGYGAADGAQMQAAKRTGASVLRAGYADGFSGYIEGYGEPCMDARIVKGRKKRGALYKVLGDADEAAIAAGTIPYKVLCDVTKRAEFIYEGG